MQRRLHSRDETLRKQDMGVAAQGWAQKKPPRVVRGLNTIYDPSWTRYLCQEWFASAASPRTQPVQAWQSKPAAVARDTQDLTWPPGHVGVKLAVSDMSMRSSLTLSLRSGRHSRP